MPGDANGAPASYGALLRAIDGLRDDFREDLHASETRVMSVVADARHDIEDFVVRHGLEHERRAADSAEEHKEFRQFIADSHLAQARRDGALGAFRYVVELTARHAPRLVAVLGTATVGLLALSGSITVTIQ